MKTIKVLAFIIALGAVAMSCSKSSTPAVSTQQAQSDISSSNSTLSAGLQDMQTQTSFKAFNNFSNLTGGTGLMPFGRIASAKNSEISAQLRVAGTNLHKMMLRATGTNTRVNSDVPFGYNDKKGVYVYNFDTHEFVKSQTASNIIEIDYPSDSTQTTNNAVFKMTAYNEQQFTDGSYTWYNTTNLQANISVDGTQQASISFVATYNTSGDMTSLNISLFLNPYTWTIDINDTNASSSSASFTLSKSGATLLGLGGTATYQSGQTKDPQYLTAISAYIQVVDIRFTATAAQNQNSDPSDPNTFISIVVTDKGAAAGKVDFVSDPSGTVSFDNGVHTFTPYVVYNDGSTKDKLSDVFANIGTSIQSLLPGGNG